jgi:hypothetical protein
MRANDHASGMIFSVAPDYAGRFLDGLRKAGLKE